MSFISNLFGKKAAIAAQGKIIYPADSGEQNANFADISLIFPGISQTNSKEINAISSEIDKLKRAISWVEQGKTAITESNAESKIPVEILMIDELNGATIGSIEEADAKIKSTETKIAELAAKLDKLLLLKKTCEIPFDETNKFSTILEQNRKAISFLQQYQPNWEINAMESFTLIKSQVPNTAANTETNFLFNHLNYGKTAFKLEAYENLAEFLKDNSKGGFVSTLDLNPQDITPDSQFKCIKNCGIIADLTTGQETQIFSATASGEREFCQFYLISGSIPNIG